MPLADQDLTELVSSVVQKMPPCRGLNVKFRDRKPCTNWISSFISRPHTLQIKAMRSVEDKRTKAVTTGIVGQHFALVKAAIHRLWIEDAIYILNIDETGFPFRGMAGKSTRKAIGYLDKKFFTKLFSTRGNHDRVKMMFVCHTAVKSCKLFVLFSGKNHRIKRILGNVQTVLNFLPECYLYQNDPAGLYSAIFLD